MDRPDKPRPVGVEPQQSVPFDKDGVHASGPPRVIVGLVHGGQRCRLVRDRDISPEKSRFRESPECRPRFLRRHVDADVARADAGSPERGIVENRRFRMRDRIPEDPQPGRRIQNGKNPASADQIIR